MARRHVFRTWDDYFIPGTSVLRNKFIQPGKPHGETDPVKLRQMEEAVTAVRIRELHELPIEGRFDYDHMKAIHRYIFHDVYEWAGEERVGPMTFMVKTGPDVVNFPPSDPRAPQDVPYRYYPAGPELGRAAEEQYRRLAAKDLLRGMGRDSFAAELAEVWGELNVIHSFREGNTRSQFVFFSQLAEQAGWRLESSYFAPGTTGREEFVAARFYSQATGSNDRLVQVLSRVIVPVTTLGYACD
ncbi:Fic family protein [Schaalia sp. ZJ1691]|uniref:Fic/DOC family protein n=1 Tax=Schaalia sp. ZJ1691 TaxID=2709404 RepID=UPI0013EA953A|nr:Fic family protein [Schaalia sp. ZJ1691]